MCFDNTELKIIFKNITRYIFFKKNKIYYLPYKSSRKYKTIFVHERSYVLINAFYPPLYFR